jgi:hypothetical protein
MNNRNLIIAIVGVLGVCVCGVCIAFGAFTYITGQQAVTSAMATVQAIGTPFALPTFTLPTLPANPTSAPLPTTSRSVPTTAGTPPIILPRGTPTSAVRLGTPTTSISRGTAAAGSTKVVFTDNFSSPCKLVEGDSEGRTFKCENNTYSMLNKTGTSRWVYYTDSYSDIVIEADGHAVSGPTFIEYGVIFRVSSDGKNYYGFTLTREGKYTLWRCDNECTDSTDFIDLISYTTSPAVKSGTATNHLKVVVQGNQIGIYVNDQWLNTVTDSTYDSGSVGFFLNNQDPNAKAAFANLSVAEISGRLTLPRGVPTPSPTPKK